LGGYYRYGPRNLAELCHDRFSEIPGDQVNIRLPKIHESVFRRIQNNAHPCAPLGIPAEYEVVTDAGQILPAHANPYETPLQSGARAKAQESVWNTVWKRRVVYFSTVFATAALVIFPLLKSRPASDEYSSPVRWISDLIRLTSSLLPSIADPWVNGYARSPITFVILATIAGALTWFGVRLASQIKSDMASIWQSTIVGGHAVTRSYNNWIYRLRTNPAYIAAKKAWKFSIGPGLSAIFFVYAGIMLLNHLAYIVLDDAGLVCTESTNATRMARGEKRTLVFDTSSVCSTTGVLLENGGRYAITIKAKETFWYDRDIPTSPAGFYSLDAPNLWHKGLMVLAVPMRRELIRPWFRIVARAGSTGGEESFLDPDPKDHTIDELLRATRDGELFLFVNDAVIGVPCLTGAFYANNVGTADVTITRR
jgi:hypothetical protein